MTKKIIRTIISIIPSLVYLLWSISLYMDFSSGGWVSSRVQKIIERGLYLSILSLLLVLICRFDIIKHIKIFLLMFISSATAIIITLYMLIDFYSDTAYLYTAYIWLIFCIVFSCKSRKINEILAFILLNPIVYYIIFLLACFYSNMARNN